VIWPTYKMICPTSLLLLCVHVHSLPQEHAYQPPTLQLWGAHTHKQQGSIRLLFSPLSLLWKNWRRLTRSPCCLCVHVSVYPPLTPESQNSEARKDCHYNTI
jgi:hypothetical protein